MRPIAIGRILSIVAALFACLPGHAVTRLLRRPSPWPRRFLGRAAHAAGARVRVEGAMRPGGTLLVANHRSWLDILVVAGASGCAFVSKEEVARWPLIGWLAGLNRTVFVARARRGEVRGQADALSSALAEGRAIALFPEGTTHAGPGTLPFRPALLASVCPAPPGVQVQPVAIDYGPARDAVAWGDDESATENALRLLGRRGTIPVVIRFLDPIDPADFPDRKALAAAARAAIERALPQA